MFKMLVTVMKVATIHQTMSQMENFQMPDYRCGVLLTVYAVCEYIAGHISTGLESLERVMSSPDSKLIK